VKHLISGCKQTGRRYIAISLTWASLSEVKLTTIQRPRQPKRCQEHRRSVRDERHSPVAFPAKYVPGECRKRAGKPADRRFVLTDFKKILQCIAKFGEELQIQATHTEVSSNPLHIIRHRLIHPLTRNPLALALRRQHLQIRVLSVPPRCRQVFPSV
jgi:hypothetical protein